MKRIVLEVGSGNDLYGEDYESGGRAVQDALHHSSLVLFRSLALDHADMEVNMTIAAMCPDVWMRRLLPIAAAAGKRNGCKRRYECDESRKRNGLGDCKYDR